MSQSASIIGRNMRKYREERSLSQAALAQDSGLSKQTIIDLEAGRGNPTIETIEGLATALNVSVRALLSEMGADVVFHSGEFVHWQDQAGMLVRSLGQTYGSGYVYCTVLRLEARRGASRLRSGSRGLLRHCYVIEGRVELGPEHRTREVCEGDFIRFPGEGTHIFNAITSTALVFVVTTAPQLSMQSAEQAF